MSIETNKTKEKKEREYMRYLHYKLANGTIVKTYSEAQAAGAYTEIMEDIHEPKRQALLDKYGVVTPKH